jgi:hypothetical protein
MPDCWVGGFLVSSRQYGDYWLSHGAQNILGLPDDSRAKYAAVKATAAILRAMRK